MAYVPSKDGNIYALDLTTGTQVWVYNYAGQFPPVGNGSRATAALVGNQLVFGTSTGTFDLDADHGHPHLAPRPAQRGREPGRAGHRGPPGSPGRPDHEHRRAIPSAFAGHRRALVQLPDPATTWRPRRRSPTATCSSPAPTASSTTSRSAAATAHHRAPPSPLQAPGPRSRTRRNHSSSPGRRATPPECPQVTVTVQEDGAAGQWWSAANQAWERGPFGNQAVLGSKGATSTTWALRVPMPARGPSLRSTRPQSAPTTSPTPAPTSPSSPPPGSTSRCLPAPRHRPCSSAPRGRPQAAR